MVAVVGMPLEELYAVPAGGDVWLLGRAEGDGGGEDRVVAGRGVRRRQRRKSKAGAESRPCVGKAGRMVRL